jgi:hypothetical protein
VCAGAGAGATCGYHRKSPVVQPCVRSHQGPVLLYKNGRMLIQFLSFFNSRLSSVQRTGTSSVSHLHCRLDDDDDDNVLTIADR